jgi:hypothetical protein
MKKEGLIQDFVDSFGNMVLCDATIFNTPKDKPGQRLEHIYIQAKRIRFVEWRDIFDFDSKIAEQVKIHAVIKYRKVGGIILCIPIRGSEDNNGFF